MKGLIVFKGKYGATSQYAQWLGQELQIPIVTLEECEPQKLLGFDFIVLAGSVYIGKWMLRDWVKRYLSFLKDKKIFFLIVCGTPASQQEEQERLAKTNIPAELFRKEDIFFLPGRVDMKKLSWMDRLALRLASRMEKDPVKQIEMRQGYDRVSKKMLGKVISTFRDLVNAEMKTSSMSQ